MPSNWHSIHKNDLARAMVAQTEQASSRLPMATIPGADGEVRATGLEQRHLAERAKHHKKSVNVEVMRRNRPTQQNLNRSRPWVFFCSTRV
jgi:hypothetical protein